jgi:hypothetical protein
MQGQFHKGAYALNAFTHFLASKQQKGPGFPGPFRLLVMRRS